MPYVLDASIAASWYFQDERDARAERALDLLNFERAVTPLHWWFEIHNVILLGERRETEQHTALFLKEIAGLAIDFAELPSNGDVLALARKHRLTFYDAAYLELAKREGLQLATLDNELAAAALAEGVTLI